MNAGRAIMFSDNYGQALQLQVKADTSTENVPLADEELICTAFDYYQSCIFKNVESSIFKKVKMRAQNVPQELKVKAFEFLRNAIPANVMLRLNSHEANVWNAYYAETIRSVVENKIISLADIANWGLAAVNHAQKDNKNIQQTVAEYFRAYMQGKKAEDEFVNKTQFMQS